jgi:hypothetical protein
MTPDLAPTLNLLGGAVIQIGTEPLGGPAAHRHRLALLALLATTGRVMSRDKLVAYLWPERDTESARNLLKTAVHELRKVLADGAIRTTGDQLSLDLSHVRCDVVEFESAVAANDLQKAAALYTGPFLDGFFLKDAHEFEHWVDAQRARLEEMHARVLAQLGSAPPASVSAAFHEPGASAPAASAPSIGGARRWRLTATISVVVLTALGTAILAAGRRGSRAGVVQSGAGAVVLPDDQLGTALEFDGTSANVSTPVGTIVSTQTDNIVVDMLVRNDGPTPHQYQMLFYNGHGAVTGWGLMVVGADDNQPQGTVAILAGGINITATPLVLTPGKWQRLYAERRDGKITLTLDDETYGVGPFPINPVASKYSSIERTTVGGDGAFNQATGHLRGAIDRLRVRSLVTGYSVERWNFDEGQGATTVGVKGAVLHLGTARWIPAPRVEPRDLFWRRLESLCMQAYGGVLTEGMPQDSAFRLTPPIMHVRSCAPNEIRIALHVGTDRSRTWVLTRTMREIALRHEHRHADGREDAVTNYGGSALDSGTFRRQDFPANAHTAALVPTARLNVWTLEIDTGERFVYSLRRPGRSVRLEFDLTKAVASPPPPWGANP